MKFLLEPESWRSEHEANRNLDAFVNAIIGYGGHGKYVRSVTLTVAHPEIGGIIAEVKYSDYPKAVVFRDKFKGRSGSVSAVVVSELRSSLGEIICRKQTDGLAS